MKQVLVAKIIVLNPAGKVLLLRRSKTYSRRPGEWDIPGGGIEPGESFTEAVTREAQEEAGITVAGGQIELLYTGTEYYAPKDESVHRALFIAHVDGDTANAVVLSYEHDMYRWVSVERALQDFPHPFYSVGLRYGVEHDLLK